MVPCRTGSNVFPSCCSDDACIDQWEPVPVEQCDATMLARAIDLRRSWLRYVCERAWAVVCRAALRLLARVAPLLPGVLRSWLLEQSTKPRR
jgi:hypothetical protein